jgi:hypothetical protein
MPTAPGEEAPLLVAARDLGRGRRLQRWLGIALIAAAVLGLIENLNWAHPGVLWGVALIGLGVLLFQQEASPTPAWSAPPPAVPPPPPAIPEDAPSTAWTAAPSGPGQLPSPPPAWPAPRPARPRSQLGWMTVAVALVAVGVVVLLGTSGAVPVGADTALAVALLSIGAGLLVGTYWGHARGLIVVGILLLPLAGVAALVDEPLDGGAGDRSWQPLTRTDVHDQYHLGAGRLTLDLSQVSFGPRPAEVHASVAFGDLVVVVPTGEPVQVSGHVGAGRLELLGRIDEGIRVDADASAPGSAGAGRLTLDLRTGMGDIRVLERRPAMEQSQ